MNELDLTTVYEYVENNIDTFHSRRISNISELKLSRALKRKNPYLFKTKNILTASEIVRALVDAHLSSNEETIFGDWLERLAIFINQGVYGGWKSGIKGVDLEFEKAGTRYIVNIKSGPNWGNSSQISKMVADFKSAKKTIRTSGAKTNIAAVNGCCYGYDKNPDKGDYLKYCGQLFWEFISGNETLYTEIVEPLGHRAKEKNEKFINAYSQIINKFTLEFGNKFCDNNGAINWIKLVKFNSEARNK